MHRSGWAILCRPEIGWSFSQISTPAACGDESRLLAASGLAWPRGGSMLTNDYQYAFEYYREDGTRLGQVSVTVDWEPAQEWARFVAIRHGRLATSDLSGATSIHPIWHPASGEPYL